MSDIDRIRVSSAPDRVVARAETESVRAVLEASTVYGELDEPDTEYPDTPMTTATIEQAGAHLTVQEVIPRVVVRSAGIQGPPGVQGPPGSYNGPQIHVGPTPPSDTSVLWVDTSEELV